MKCSSKTTTFRFGIATRQRIIISCPSSLPAIRLSAKWTRRRISSASSAYRIEWWNTSASSTLSLKWLGILVALEKLYTSCASFQSVHTLTECSLLLWYRKCSKCAWIRTGRRSKIWQSRKRIFAGDALNSRKEKRRMRSCSTISHFVMRWPGLLSIAIAWVHLLAHLLSKINDKSSNRKMKIILKSWQNRLVLSRASWRRLRTVIFPWSRNWEWTLACLNLTRRTMILPSLIRLRRSSELTQWN